MQILFLDESGEFGHVAGSSKHLLIALLSPKEQKALKNAMKREKKRLHDLGWPTDVEIKGNTLFGCQHYQGVPQKIIDKRFDHLDRIIRKLVEVGANPHYAIINKSALKEHLKKAPYGIAYNYFTGNLICKIYKQLALDCPITLVVDQRNKETHHQMPFDGYIATRVISDCEHQHPFDIKHEESHKWLGLQAADFLSWGLFRYYEHGDDRYQKLIAPSVGVLDNWYAKK